ncbi:MAG TPA: cytochrome P450 [Candidatus Limnocylindrales bacterium]|nr:cytochrome P450 [Candidatus Limnocylindrales bacterium]
MLIALPILLFIATLPYWLPGAVVALRMWIFARVNGDEGLVLGADADTFRRVYSHPAADGRSRGAVLSDLFWYWLSPGPEMHQEHLEPGPRYEAVARTTRAILAMPTARAETLAAQCASRVLSAAVPRWVRLRDLMMPVWAEFYYEVVFGRPCPVEARDLIVGNANDVVTSLKCCGLRHLDVRLRLTSYLIEAIKAGEIPHALPDGLSTQESAYYLQGAFFNTAVVQMSEAMTHLLLVVAEHPFVLDRLDDDRFVDGLIDEALRMYPLFGIAHRITSADIPLDEQTTIPTGSVVCFDYPAYHRLGFADPDRFDPARPFPRDAHHIPFGMPANRPCPAWRLAPVTMRAVLREMLRHYRPYSSAAHLRSIPNRGPCVLVPTTEESQGRPGFALALMRLRDRWEDVSRSLIQLTLGTYMVWDARRLKLCTRHFADSDSVYSP